MSEAPKEHGRRALPVIATVTLLGGAVLGALTLSPALAQQARSLGSIVNSVLTCHSSSPCAGGSNTGSGLGVVGVSAKDNGVDGATKNPSATSGFGRSGVYGHDDSGDGGPLNVGVAGYSAWGFGMLGTTSSGEGVKGTATASGTGVAGVSTAGNGVYAESGANALIAVADGGGSGLFATSAFGNAIVGWQKSGNPYEALSLRSGTADANGHAIQVIDTNMAPLLDLDNAGNVHITGQLFTKGSCSIGCSRTHRVTSYAPRESLPSMEDIGEGQLVAGETRVKLDPAFANVIDKGAPYAVFVSPEGPNHGLYVTQKSPSGFTVMENPGGHSTIPFSYRIVAKPYGAAAARLPMTYETTSPTHTHTLRLPERRATH
jgi:hypothetical protein